MKEKDLINNLKSGNRAAFNELIKQYSSRVMNTCYRFLLNQHDAEDIAQEVFIEVYQSMTTGTLTTPKALNINNTTDRTIFNSFRVVRQIVAYSVDFIYGYSYLILSEL